VKRFTSIRPVAVVVMAGLLLASLAACSGGEAEAKPQETTTTSESTTTTIPPTPAPLTGVPLTDGAIATRPALAVKIENHPDARPQTGLAAADLVYEEVVEGGLTRFWAVFQSSAPETVGPIRSVRAMDPAIVSPLRGIVAFSGGTPPNVALMRAAPVTPIDENNAGSAYFRLRERRAPHNLYGRTDELWAKDPDLPPPTQPFERLGASEPCAGQPVGSTHLGFSRGYDPTWTWDAASSRFLRSYGASPFMDASGDQIATDNVLVLSIAYRGAGGNGQLIGSGSGWLFCGGAATELSWSKADNNAPILLTDAFGGRVRLKPGKTWVELLPVGGAVDLG
jgi:Protein of unknown function (DUF3048) N-terminal domain/Protein of unknown function (DUF3048) C-terminal domain